MAEEFGTYTGVTGIGQHWNGKQVSDSKGEIIGVNPLQI